MHHHDIGHAHDACDRRDVAEEIVALIALGVPTSRSVYPSAGARTTASVPIIVDAPGRFSITNCWPRRSESHWPISRARMSVVPAGANGTIKRTGRVG